MISFGSFDVTEYSSIEELAQMAEIITSAGDTVNCATSFLAGLYDDLDTIQAKVNDVSILHDSRGDYAKELTECCYDVHEYLIYHVNYDAMGRDMEINGEINEVDHDAYITNAQEF